MFSRAVTKASTLKQRARDAYKARRKVVREQSVDQLLANAPLFASLSMDERADLADQVRPVLRRLVEVFVGSGLVGGR